MSVDLTRSIEVLDCTLRDGGYINSWQFDDEACIHIIKSLLASGVEYIECGYLSQTRGLGKHSTLFSDLTRLESLLSSFVETTQANFVVMINHGEVDVSTLPEQNALDYVTGIRLAFHQKDIDEALTSAKTLIEKGYSVFIQPMVTGGYSDIAILQLIEQVNQLKPFAFYLVDSFGSMTGDRLEQLFHLVDNNLLPDIKIGFHSHNNKQLSYANGIRFVGFQSARSLLIDASIFGMGRGAGNLLTEVFTDFLNQQYGKDYQITALLEVIDNYLEAVYRQYYWGYSVAHFLSAAVECHPNYASYLTNKKTLPVAAIHQILNKIEDEYKKSFNTAYIEKLYLQHQIESENEPATDVGCAIEDWENKVPLIIGAGASVSRQLTRVVAAAAQENVTVIGINHLPDLSGVEGDLAIDYVFFSNQKRYLEHYDKITDSSKLIVTSNITPVAKHKNCRCIAYHQLYNHLPYQSHNAALLLLAYLQLQGAQRVWCAGIDGYLPESQKNYSYEALGQLVDRKEILQQNEEIATALKAMAVSMRFRFITDSIYSHYIPKRILGVIPARYQSSRFPGKPLAEINGVPMLKRTYQQAKQCEALNELIIATDDERIAQYCKSEKIPYLMTSTQCSTGTDRIAEVAAQVDYDLYINIQGDEPVIDPRVIAQVIEQYYLYGDEYLAYNCYKVLDVAEDIPRDSIIKVVVNAQNELMYMSRLPIPFNKSDTQREYLKQVCVYGFTPEALSVFANSEKTLNETFEDVEILRLVDLGHKVRMIETSFDSLAVDLPEDVARVEDFLNEN